MKATLVSYTQAADQYKDNFSTIKELVAYCARVSNPSNQMNNESADKLIKYLLKHKHFSPFEMANICVEIQTTRDIARQILRHRSFSFQEFSQRYADPTDMEFEWREARLQDVTNRQNSLDEASTGLKIAWIVKQRELVDKALEAYNWAIEHGIAKEVARAVLPEGNTPSVMYMNGTIRSWIHYIEIRAGEETQKEHREIALAVAEAISEIFQMEV